MIESLEGMGRSREQEKTERLHMAGRRHVHTRARDKVNGERTPSSARRELFSR